MSASSDARGPASLACAAPARPGQHGALTLKGLIPATESALNLTLTEGSQQVKWLAESGDAVQVIAAWEDRVFTLTVQRKGGGADLQLYARPSSIRIRKGKYELHARFQAVLWQAPRPAAPGTPPALLHAVELTCQYDYEV